MIYKSTDGNNAVNGTGWIPINFNKTPGGSPLSKLPLDPLNDAGHYYGYACNPKTDKFELNVKLESDKYSPLMDNSKDGGNNNKYYEIGTDLEILP